MQFAEGFISNILTPLALMLLVITGVAVFTYVRPFSILWLYISKKRNERSSTSSLSAMLTALAGTLGVGNISGVALAISCGGCGAVFWMWVSALFAMSVKYAEILLASHYRTVKKDGPHGGAPLYISAAFKGRGGRALSRFFTMLCIVGAFTVGSSVQSGAAAEITCYAFDIPPAICGAALGICVLACICGGTKRISKVTDVLVPLMSGAYLILSLFVIYVERNSLPQVFSGIFRSAFGLRQAVGGAAGYGLAAAVRYGVSRGLISNEAGCGTSPFAHARTDSEPAEQGLFGIAEVFIDTIVLCTVTAVSIIAAYDGNIPTDKAGMVIVCDAYGKYLGSAAPAVLCVAVVLFAFGSIICWYYYGMECLLITGAKKTAKTCFAAIFIFCVFMGAVVNGRHLWLCADLCFDMLLTVNTAAVLKEVKTVKRITDKYVYSRKRARDSASTAIRLSSRGRARAIPHSEADAP